MKMDSSSTLVIETDHLSKAYKGVQALKDLNLTVKQHSIFGFLGPNGAGKTTTIKLLLGLARPTSGSARIFGYDIQRDIENRIQETLELVGLNEKADRPIKGFSGGERQRLGIAQAQINYPDLLILDEPAASLDPQGSRDVIEVMERLRKYTTIFYSTHILDDVQRVSDTVAILNKGKLVAQAPIEELLAGSGETIYRLTLASGAEQVRAILQAQPWVKSLSQAGANGAQSLSVSVSDETAAKDQLLRLALSDPSVTVLEFGQQKYNLEDIFLAIVEGGQHGG